MFVLLCLFMKKKTQAVFFPPSVMPLSTMLNWSRAVIPSGVHYCSNVSRSGYIWFYSRSCDQESTNGCPCLVEWKSKNITMSFIIIADFCLFFKSEKRMQKTFWRRSLPFVQKQKQQMVSKTFTDAANANKFFRLLHPISNILHFPYKIRSFKVSTELWLIKKLVIDFYRFN